MSVKHGSNLIDLISNHICKLRCDVNNIRPFGGPLSIPHLALHISTEHPQPTSTPVKQAKEKQVSVKSRAEQAGSRVGKNERGQDGLKIRTEGSANRSLPLEYAFRIHREIEPSVGREGDHLPLLCAVILD